MCTGGCKLNHRILFIFSFYDLLKYKFILLHSLQSSDIVLTINGENCHDADTVSNYFNDFLQVLLLNLLRNYLQVKSCMI
jgi:hypothetical protein